jgi:hypothetical protein
MDTTKNEIHTLEQQETRDDFVKSVPIVDKVDYSGAHEKTDPREIALVKKLDRWNAHAVVNVLAEVGVTAFTAQ